MYVVLEIPRALPKTLQSGFVVLSFKRYFRYLSYVGSLFVVFEVWSGYISRTDFEKTVAVELVNDVLVYSDLGLVLLCCYDVTV